MTENRDYISNEEIMHADPEQLNRLFELFRFAQAGHCLSAVTHDANNMLGAIMAYAELLMLDPGVKEDSHKMLANMADAAKRGSLLMNSLTGIIQKRKAQEGIADMAVLLQETVSLNSYDFKVFRIDFELILDDELPSMLVNAGDLKLALLALIANMQEALENAPERRAELRARKSEQYLSIEVWNSGPPIAQEIRERIFQPFFTTKTAPHLGLGLPVARRIARSHEGGLEYDPERGFVLTLPIERTRATTF